MAVKRLTLVEETVDYAIKKGLSKLGLRQDQTLIHVLQREAQSLFGYREAVVAITYDEEDSEIALASKRTVEFKSKFRFRFHEGEAQVQVPAAFYDDRYVSSKEERETYLREYLSEYQVDDPDDEAITAIIEDFHKQYDYTTVKKLQCFRLNRAGAKLHLKVDEDLMRAQAIIFPKGRVKQEDVFRVLKKNNIVQGILINNITGVLQNPIVDYFDIARGKEAVDDQPGAVEKYFTEDEHKEFAKMMELLHIDTRSVKDINIADRHQLLMKIGEIRIGQNGYRIDGTVLEKTDITEDEAGVQIGENVYLSDDKRQVFAKISGHIKWRAEDNLLDVEPVYIVDGNVDFSEGNIIGFVGKVIIKGDVKPKFTVIAEGDVEVQGCVEDATVKSTYGKVMVAGSVVHNVEGMVQAKETVHVNIATNARIKATDVLIEKEAINSRIEAENKIEAVGSPGVIIGGLASAKHLVRANTIGSESEVATDIRAGDVSELKRRLKALNQKMSKQAVALKEARQVRRILSEREENQELTFGQQTQLKRARQEIPDLEESLLFGEEEEVKIRKEISERKDGRVEVLKTLHPQVDIRIFEGYWIPESAEQYSGFHCEKGEVQRYAL